MVSRWGTVFDAVPRFPDLGNNKKAPAALAELSSASTGEAETDAATLAPAFGPHIDRSVRTSKG